MSQARQDEAGLFEKFQTRRGGGKGRVALSKTLTILSSPHP